MTGLWSAVAAVIVRLFGVCTRDGRSVRLNAASASRRVRSGVSPPSSGAGVRGAKSVFLTALCRHASMTSGSRTVSSVARYASSVIWGKSVRTRSRTMSLKSWLLGGPRRTPVSEHRATHENVPLGGSHGTSFAS